ncbi:MAG TPA: NAD(P)/FAD-dependent oxidoreductase [Phycisphaerales bacterium]|nr:NAD(P)/FAD-dependent oxidoreductase [Phycisphaerales bacterium]
MSVGAGKSVLIVGAGLAGSLLASYLAKLGYTVTVVERRGDPRVAGYQGGRSINLALSARGLWALDGVGLKDEVLRHAIPMRGRIMHAAELNPTLVFQPYGSRPEHAINSISRGGLNLALLNAAARHPNVTLLFDRRCTDVDVPSCTAHFVNAAGMEERLSADLVIGADGAFSAVRGALQKTDRFEYSQSYLGHGYKELHIPALAEGAGPHNGFALDPNALHIWPRGSAMMIALPNPDRSFTCTLFWPFEGEHGFAGLSTADAVRSFFERNYPDAVPLMPTLVEDFLENPVGSLVTVRCRPWARHGERGTVAVLGDAAHAIVPFFGQGMNAAFEDVRVLAECLQRHNADTRAAVDECQRLRKPNADAIAQMALENFIEMRDKVGSRAFLWKKKLEHAVQGVAPGKFPSRYELVSFSTVPYAEAMEAGRRFDRLLLVAAACGVLLLGMLLSLITWFAGWAILAGVFAGLMVGMKWNPPPPGEHA